MNPLSEAAKQALGFVTSEAWGTTPYMDVRVYEDAARLRDVLQAALAQQVEPLNLADPAIQKRLASQWGYVPAAAQAEPVDVGLLEYRGNSVAFIHQKMTAYRTGIDVAWDAFRANGLHPDGKTSLADMIAKHTAPPQRTMVPLTAQELDGVIERHVGGSEITDAIYTSMKQFARAVEKTSWEKNHGRA